MMVLVFIAIVMIAFGFGVVAGAWMMNNAFRYDALNGNACLIGGKVYTMTGAKKSDEKELPGENTPV